MELRLRLIPIALLAVLLSSPVCFSQAAAQTPSSAPTQQRPTSEPGTYPSSKRQAETSGCRSIA
jgi:hypothetical protein